MGELFQWGKLFLLFLRLKVGGTNLKRGAYLMEHTNLSIYSNLNVHSDFYYKLENNFYLNFNM